MDPQGGLHSLENLRKAGNYHCKMYNIPYAGHHGALPVYDVLPVSDRASLVYLDNPTAVNELLVGELDGIGIGEQLHLFASSHS